MKNAALLKKLVNATAAFGIAGSLAACASGPTYPVDAYGNMYGPPPGANVVTGIRVPGVRQTGYCAEPRQIRERHRNTAGQLIRDFQVGTDSIVVPCGTVPDPVGRCYIEQPVGVPSYNDYGNFAGSVAVEIRSRRVPCGPMDPYSYR